MNILQWKIRDITYFPLEVDDRVVLIYIHCFEPCPHPNMKKRDETMEGRTEC